MGTSVSLVEHLLESRSKLDLAKELAAAAKENAHLKNEVFRLEHELFWMKATERNQDESKNSPDH